MYIFPIIWGFPCGSVLKEFTCQYQRLRRHRFDLWVRKIPQRRKWESTPVFLPGKSYGQRSLAGYSLRRRKCWKWLSVCAHTHALTHVCARAHTHTHIFSLSLSPPPSLPLPPIISQVASSHIWLLSTWSVPGVTEKLCSQILSKSNYFKLK